MPRNSLAIASHIGRKNSGSKPRYTEAENDILFESWWDPQRRQELTGRLGRKMSALRSQFCRLLKEKGMTNKDYYNLMQARHSEADAPLPRRRCRELKEIDRSIIEVFAKHQAIGNSRADACEELRQRFGNAFSIAALKLRFYRLIKRLRYSDDELLEYGQQLLGKKETDANRQHLASVASIAAPSVSPSVTRSPQPKPTVHSESDSFFFQISSLPDTIHILEERLAIIEEKQHNQLDLRGFIEHLLAVERDLKREDKLMNEIQRLMDENESIRSQSDHEQERLVKREAELAEVYRILEGMLSDFMHLESVSKLASLGDFMHRLEVTVDQFGNVLRSKRIPAPK